MVSQNSCFEYFLINRRKLNRLTDHMNIFQQNQTQQLTESNEIIDRINICLIKHGKTS